MQVQIQILQSETFDATTHIGLLHDLTEEQIRSYAASLEATRASIVKDIKLSVSSNYKIFTALSNTIKVLDPNILLLRSSIKSLLSHHSILLSNIDDLPIANQSSFIQSPAKLLMDCFGKYYANIEDLSRARGKQIVELYNNIENLNVL